VKLSRLGNLNEFIDLTTLRLSIAALNMLDYSLLNEREWRESYNPIDWD